MSIDVSFVLTVYNKEKVLPFVIQALHNQQGLGEAEYIFVDDHSSDGSIEAIKETTARLGMKNVKVALHKQRKGPSVRINQGIELAKGNFVFLMDGDDILALNAVSEMKQLMEETSADCAKGKFFNAGLTAQDLMNKTVSTPAKYFLSDNPLSTVLRSRLINNLGILVRRDVFDKIQGADESVFRHDVSLMLKISAHSKYMVVVKENCVYIPFVEGGYKLSRDYQQFLYDSFFARYNFLQSYPLNPDEEKQLERLCIKEGWKYVLNAGFREPKPLPSRAALRWLKVRRFFSWPKVDRHLGLYLLSSKFHIKTDAALKDFSDFLKRDMRLLKGKLRDEDIKISSVEPKDAQEVKLYLQQIVNETRFVMSTASDWRIDARRLVEEYERLTPREGVYLKAVVEGKIVGICSLKCPKQTRIRQNAMMGLSVMKSYWGRGIATRLIQAAVKWAKKQDFMRIEIIVNIHNKRAISLLRRCDFVYEGLLKKTIKVGDKYFDAYLMTYYLFKS